MSAIPIVSEVDLPTGLGRRLLGWARRVGEWLINNLGPGESAGWYQ